MFRRWCKGLEKKYKTPKYCGPKYKKQKSYRGSNFEDDSDFLKIGELWSTYFDVFGKPSERATSHQNFVGLCSKTKKLLSDQFLNFDPDFLEIAELWSKYFGFVKKPQERATRPSNIVGLLESRASGLGLLKSTFHGENFICRLSWSISNHFVAIQC